MELVSLNGKMAIFIKDNLKMMLGKVRDRWVGKMEVITKGTGKMEFLME